MTVLTITATVFVIENSINGADMCDPRTGERLEFASASAARLARLDLGLTSPRYKILEKSA